MSVSASSTSAAPVAAPMLAVLGWVLLVLAWWLLSRASAPDFAFIGWAALAAMVGVFVHVVGFILAIVAVVHAGKVGGGVLRPVAAIVASLVGALGNGVLAAILLLTLATGAAVGHMHLH